MTFAAAGDIFINRRLPERAYAGFEKLSALIGSAEVRFANLETTIHNREGYPFPFSGGTWAMSAPEVLEDVKKYGFNIYNAANNHAIFYTGNIVENGSKVFTSCDITTSIIIGFTAASFAALLVGTVQKRFSFMEGFQQWTAAFANGMEAVVIIALAWCLSTVSGNLGLKFFVAHVIESAGVSPALIPALVYIGGCAISFATGSSWGTTALMMPIAIPVCYSYGIDLEIAIAACIGGGLFGDHCSPVSDTTIKASMAAGCDHIQHVRTQLPYALTSGLSAFVAYIVAGLVNNTLIGVVTAIVIAITAINVQNKLAVKRYADYDFSGEAINPNLVAK